eukprot:1951188-Rhodomonas_salina.1
MDSGSGSTDGLPLSEIISVIFFRGKSDCAHTADPSVHGHVKNTDTSRPAPQHSTRGCRPCLST